jgi:hypothetical protein
MSTTPSLVSIEVRVSSTNLLEPSRETFRKSIIDRSSLLGVISTSCDQIVAPAPCCYCGVREDWCRHVSKSPYSYFGVRDWCRNVCYDGSWESDCATKTVCILNSRSTHNSSSVNTALTCRNDTIVGSWKPSSTQHKTSVLFSHYLLPLRRNSAGMLSGSHPILVRFSFIR